jgi:MFS transporter, ACS family, allantoate permease
MISILISGFLGDYFGQRVLASAGGLVGAIVGILLIITLPLTNKVGRLLGIYLMAAGASPFVALLSLISTNVAGYTKKTTVAALYLISYCIGNLIGMSS